MQAACLLSQYGSFPTGNVGLVLLIQELKYGNNVRSEAISDKSYAYKTSIKETGSVNN